MLIELTQGKFATIDNEDYELVRGYKWQALRSVNGFYAVHAYLDKTTGKNRKLFLHKLVIGAGDNEQVDHRNRNTLDCRKQNLRQATSAQNAWNRGRQANNLTSHYKRVYFDKTHGRFRAKIMSNGRVTYLGYFRTEEEAASAYSKACSEQRGEWAVI